MRTWFVAMACVTACTRPVPATQSAQRGSNVAWADAARVPEASSALAAPREMRIVPVVRDTRALAGLVAPLQAARDAETGAFVTRQVLAGEGVSSACAAVTAWMRTQAPPVAGAQAACGAHPRDGRAMNMGDDSDVRGYWLEGAALWGERDVVEAAVWYDEDTLPLHGHVVVRVAAAALARWATWSAANRDRALAVVWGEQVYGTGVGIADGNRVWITLPTERSGDLPGNNVASLALESHLKSLMRDP